MIILVGSSDNSPETKLCVTPDFYTPDDLPVLGMFFGTENTGYVFCKELKTKTFRELFGQKVTVKRTAWQVAAKEHCFFFHRKLSRQDWRRFTLSVPELLEIGGKIYPFLRWLEKISFLAYRNIESCLSYPGSFLFAIYQSSPTKLFDSDSEELETWLNKLLSFLPPKIDQPILTPLGNFYKIGSTFYYESHISKKINFVIYQCNRRTQLTKALSQWPVGITISETLKEIVINYLDTLINLMENQEPKL